MAITLMSPDGLPKNHLYEHVSIATGSKLVSVSGQVSWDENGTAVAPGDLAAQIEHTYRNVATALATAGATFDDVARLKVYVVDWTPDQMPVLEEGLDRAAKMLGSRPVPPISVIGVSALDVPEHLVEVEATAVLD